MKNFKSLVSANNFCRFTAKEVCFAACVIVMPENFDIIDNARYEGSVVMRIAICDDEKEIREMLTEKVLQVFPQADLSCYSSGEELLFASNRPDILLLDIKMAGKNGMETAREFRKIYRNTILIFVTAFEEFVFQSFDVGAFHYLVKPFENKKFVEVLRSAERELEDKKVENDDKKRQGIIISTGGRHIVVDPEEIIYAEVFDRKVTLHMICEDIEYYGKLKELQKKAGEDFYRPHRAYLVNFNYIRKYDATTIYLEKGQALMAKQNYREFVQCYLRYNQKRG